MNRSIGEGDADENRYGVNVLKDGAPVDLSGCTVTGYFLKPDGTTVIMSGFTSGSKAYVSLPATCYAVEGQFTLAIKLTGGGVTGTMRVIDGTVINTSNDNVIDPGGTVPDITALMAVISRAEAAAEDIAKFAVTEELISGTDYRVIISVTEGD